jgi:hypothetical protein
MADKPRPALVPGEHTSHHHTPTQSVIVNVLDAWAIADYFDGTTTEELRVMIMRPDGPAVFVSMYPDGTWAVTTTGIATVDVE